MIAQYAEVLMLAEMDGGQLVCNRESERKYREDCVHRTGSWTGAVNYLNENMNDDYAAAIMALTAQGDANGSHLSYRLLQTMLTNHAANIIIGGDNSQRLAAITAAGEDRIAAFSASLYHISEYRCKFSKWSFYTYFEVI